MMDTILDRHILTRHVPDVVNKVRKAVLQWSHRLEKSSGVRQILSRWNPSNDVTINLACWQCAAKPANPQARFCTKCGTPRKSFRLGAFKAIGFRSLIVLCSTSEFEMIIVNAFKYLTHVKRFPKQQRVLTIGNLLRTTILDYSARLEKVNVVRRVRDFRALRGRALPTLMCARCNAKPVSPEALFCSKCGGSIARQAGGHASEPLRPGFPFSQ
jgi:hypothetical protein